MTTDKKRILSGVQPTGKLHLGNYFGAVRQHVALQDEGECFYFIADYHSMTTIDDPAEGQRTAGQKMSKADGNAIDIFAEGKPLKKAVMGIVTDSTPVEAPKNPDQDTVFALYSLFATDAERAALAERYRAGGMGYGEAKQMLLAKIDEHFGPAREKRKQLAADPDYVENVLRQGAAKARAEAQTTMKLVRTAAG